MDYRYIYYSAARLGLGNASVHRIYETLACAQLLNMEFAAGLDWE